MELSEALLEGLIRFVLRVRGILYQIDYLGSIRIWLLWRKGS